VRAGAGGKGQGGGERERGGGGAAAAGRTLPSMQDALAYLTVSATRHVQPPAPRGSPGAHLG
jgi:hypothetical protein